MAQRECATSSYIQQEQLGDPALVQRIQNLENFIALKKSLQARETGGGGMNIIRIPVVVHVLYNTAAQNIPDDQILSQIDVLNKDFRRLNADTAATPERFRSLAADCSLEFYLATADPLGRSTDGIVRRYTPVSYWQMDDHIKFSSLGGDDAWDSRFYLNLWVGNTKSLLGYASTPGGAAEKDGVVINTSAFGTINTVAPYDLGRTTTHEVGHWLGLKHIWGDSYCGDDLVEDTPKQGNFTSGCPSGFRSSCSNGTDGDMYMNFMDFTNDACMNLFTYGQKQRLLALFSDGGPRQSILQSKGLAAPWNMDTAAAPLPVQTFRYFPNPARNEFTLQVEDRWIGKTVTIISLTGVVQSRTVLYSNSQKLSIGHLAPGIYFIHAQDGNRQLKGKLVKL